MKTISLQFRNWTNCPRLSSIQRGLKHVIVMASLISIVIFILIVIVRGVRLSLVLDFRLGIVPIVRVAIVLDIWFSFVLDMSLE